MSYLVTDFPFSAVQGQDQFKKALILAAIYPAIGGVLVSGPRGSAKSTLARALANILPLHNDSPCPFVTLPLATSLEMLTGTLDLQQVLNEQELKFSPGLLSKADTGILYVDEVNLLSDHLVDQLLDVAASGVNRVERDGISHAHPSKFSLIGTMNPDEGELREQFKDRFGLMVSLNVQLSLEQRVEIVKSRESFEQQPQQFLALYEAQQQQLIEDITLARNLLTSISCSDQLRIEIAKRCQSAGVDGLRADIVMYRAALANAAWRNANAVAIQDIDAVQELVLAHRRKVGQSANDKEQNDQSEGGDSNSSDGSDSGSGNGADKNPDSGNENADNSAEQQNNPAPEKSKSNNGGFKRPSESSTKNHPSNAQESDWGGMQAPQKIVLDPSQSLQMQQTHTHLNTLFEQQSLQSANHANKTSQLSQSKRAGKKHNSVVDSLADSFDVSSNQSSEGRCINWFSTLLNSLGNWPQLQLKYQQKQTCTQVLHLVLLDTSASTLIEQLSAKAKACVLEISKQAYLQRENIQVLGFGNNGVQQILSKVRAPKELSKLLNSVDVAGGTPLRLMLEQTQKLLQPLLKRQETEVRCYLITDGRSRAQVSDIKLKVPTVLIDTESSTVKRGRGIDIAQQLNAQYYALA